MGIPASIKASEQPQTVAIELELLDSVMSDTRRIVYGKDSSVGITGSMARSPLVVPANENELGAHRDWLRRLGVEPLDSES